MTDAHFDHPYAADASFDGGELDCGSGLLLLIRRHIDPLAPGQLLEIRSRESSVGDDLPSWCRMTGNELVHHAVRGGEHSFLVAKGAFAPPATTSVAKTAAEGERTQARAGGGRTSMPASTAAAKPVVALATAPAPAPAPGDRAALGHGRRLVAAPALDAARDPRAPREAA